MGHLMPRSAAAKGRTGYPAMMDERWRESVQGPVSQQFLARVTVRDADTRGEYDETTHGHTNTAGAVVWQGMGRLVALPAVGSTPQNAGQTVTLRGYRLTIPYPGMMFKPGQRVSFDSDDPVLDALVLTVSANQAASIRLQTSVVLEADEG